MDAGGQIPPWAPSVQDRARIVTIDDVAVAFGAKRVLEGVTLDVRRGEIVALLGPNGAGKSTLSRAISGQQRVDRGTIRVLGGDPARSSKVRAAIGLVPQKIALYEKLTARENLSVFGAIMRARRRGRRERILSLLEKVGLSERADDVVSTLSGGMRRRINIAAALMHEPDLVILDEPTVGLDAAARSGIAELLQHLRAEGVSILLVTHDLEEAELIADRVIILAQGRVQAVGTPQELSAEFFSHLREVRLASPRHKGFTDLSALLASLGFVRGEDDVWRAEMAHDDPRLASLFQAVTQNRIEADEFTVRRPSLSRLLAFALARSGGTR